MNFSVRNACFPDEGGLFANGKHQPGTPEEQATLADALGVGAAMRFVNMGTAAKPNVLNFARLTLAQVQEVLERITPYGVSFDFLGSGIGKGGQVAKTDDGSKHARFSSGQEYQTKSVLHFLKEH